MAIKLRVISDHFRSLGEQRSRVFGVNGGTIGRALDNDWVLPDAKRLVSGHHCEIEYRGGEYWLHDRSTNGVWINDADEPVSRSGPLVLRDGDRLRIGDYELIVSVDARIDFLPVSGEEESSARHIDHDIGASLDLDSLLSPRDPEESGFPAIRDAFRPGLQREYGPQQRPVHAAPAEEVVPDPPSPRRKSGPPDRPASSTQSPPDWAMKTRAMTRQELTDAMARRQSRIDARQATQPFHRQAAAWTDLQSALQAFCRGAGIEPSMLSPEARSMLPLVAGQMLREAVVGLTHLAQSQSHSAPAAVPSPGSNPLRSSQSVEQSLVRLFEAHGRLHGGPVEALRDVLQEAKDHDAAVQVAMREGLAAVLGRLDPTSVADQFEQGRARALAAGQDPRPMYWEHFTEFHRVISQSTTEDGLPQPFVEAFRRAYAAKREELRKRAGSGEDADAAG